MLEIARVLEVFNALHNQARVRASVRVRVRGLG